ncbi:hypothetical protein Tco_1487362, partial [Tanacetum coccineum]
MSVWVITVDTKDNCGWKCLFSLRDWIGSHMRYKIGDGKSTTVWHDKWNNEVSISSIINKKEIFYAGFTDHATIQNVLDDKGWKWPYNWLVKYPWIASIQTSKLSNTPDKLCLAAGVYFIWQERNMRLFNSHKRDEKELFEMMCEDFRAKMISICVKENVNVL